MKIATWNVNGIRARGQQVADWLSTARPDALCLQEIKASPAQVPDMLTALAEYECYWHGHKGYSGVALLLRRATFGAAAFEHPAFDHENRIVVARAAGLTLASIYMPNGGKDFAAKLRFLEALEQFAAAEQAAGSRLILCGDLNVALEERDVHVKLRNAEQIGQTAHERELLAKIISRGLVDLGRRFHPSDDALFTWWAPWRNMKERNIGWRLDYVLASESLAAAARSCEHLREVGTSDHGPVVAELDVELVPREAAPGSAAGAKAGRAQLPLL